MEEAKTLIIKYQEEKITLGELYYGIRDIRKNIHDITNFEKELCEFDPLTTFLLLTFQRSQPLC